MNYKVATIDFYDDGGKLLRKVVPNPDDLPDFVKTAALLEPESGGQLYALVMVDEGEILKKYAMVDRGNTWLSVLYFSMNHDQLPEGAQKVAAANLLNACHDFDIEPPDLLTALAAGARDVGTNIIDITDLEPGSTRVGQQKTAAETEDVSYAIERADGSKYYPLKDATSVATAMEYFGDHGAQFVPRERREYAVKVAAAAQKGRLPLTEEISHYASEDWNPRIESYIAARDVHLVERGSPEDAMARAALQKLATARASMQPAQFAALLEEFDHRTGLDALWDRYVPDPYYSTFGFQEKTAEAKVYELGVVTVNSDDIRSLAERGLEMVADAFGEQVAGSFVKDPIAVFESLPAPMKLAMAKLAANQNDWA